MTNERGFALEVYPSGGMCWRYRYRLNGRLEKVVLGKYPDMTLKMARDKRDELGRLVAAGQSPARQKQLGIQALADAVTVKDFADRFFREIQDKVREDNTIPRRYLDKDILPFIGTMPVRDLTAEDLRQIIWRKKDHGFDAAAGQIRGLLKRMLDYAVTCGLLAANPVMALPMFCFLTMQTSIASAREFHVATHGSDANRGTKSAPCAQSSAPPDWLKPET